MNTDTTNISTESAYAAREIARAHPFSKKHSSTWIHYCEYCRYTGQTVRTKWENKPQNSIRLLQIDGKWYRLPQVTRQLKKLMK